jgi:hypothetical protein
MLVISYRGNIRFGFASTATHSDFQVAGKSQPSSYLLTLTFHSAPDSISGLFAYQILNRFTNNTRYGLKDAYTKVTLSCHRPSLAEIPAKQSESQESTKREPYLQCTSWMVRENRRCGITWYLKLCLRTIGSRVRYM